MILAQCWVVRVQAREKRPGMSHDVFCYTAWTDYDDEFQDRVKIMSSHAVATIISRFAQLFPDEEKQMVQSYET